MCDFDNEEYKYTPKIHEIPLISIFFHRDLLAQNRRGVVFADGVAPGYGTSASEESANEDDDLTSSNKLSSRTKTKKNVKNLTSFSTETTPMFIEKENLFEIKVSLRNEREREREHLSNAKCFVLNTL